MFNPIINDLFCHCYTATIPHYVSYPRGGARASLAQRLRM